ncbi:carbohydrate kinase family protein [Anaerovorax odorimutans]|uniref:carbohydrate kinase family protein n=1 Tax=Anaerovorax odorimutans TaxID=109327 RepID=UPI00040C75D7|nr:carbohydrate kinase family protein [Anaerovorax odorimutans]
MSKIGVIGGASANIEASAYGQIMKGESNSGTIGMSFSGSGRNITENLARIGEDVVFVSTAGDDFSGKSVVRELKEAGVNVDFVKLLPGQNTACNISILNMISDLEMALSNMDVMEKLTNDMIDEALEELQNCKVIGIDATLSEDTLKYVIEKFEGIPLFLDPDSEENAKKVKEFVGQFHTVKPNRREAEAITGLTILSADELEKAGECLIEKGVKRVYITLSGGGVYYTDGKEKGFMRTESPKPVSEAGAGDAFSAAILRSLANDCDIKTSAQYGMAAASIALETKYDVNNQISSEKIEKRYKELF